MFRHRGALQATDVPDVGLEYTDSVRATDEQLLPSEAARVLLFELTSRDVSNMEILHLWLTASDPTGRVS